MPGQQHVIGKDDVVADLAIVGDMGANHQQVMIADLRRLSLVQGAVDGAILAKRVVRADQHPADFFGHLRVLRRSAQDRSFHHAIAGAECHAAFDDDAAGQLAAVADFRIGFDNRVGTDDDIAADLGQGTDQRKRVDAHRREPLGRWRARLPLRCLSLGGTLGGRGEESESGVASFSVRRNSLRV